MEELVRLRAYIASSLPNLKNAVFYIRLTQDELEAAISKPDSQLWIRAFKMLPMQRIEVKLLVYKSDPDPEYDYRPSRCTARDREEFFKDQYSLGLRNFKPSKLISKIMPEEEETLKELMTPDPSLAADFKRLGSERFLLERFGFHEELATKGIDDGQFAEQQIVWTERG